MGQPWASQGLVGHPEISHSLFWRVQTRDMKDPTCRHQQFAPHRGVVSVSIPALGWCTASPSPGPGAKGCLEMVGFVYKAKQGVCGDGECREVLANMT